jgi:hypothetical protein
VLSAQIPLAMASKTMRHSTLSTTTEIYGHLLRHVALQAVDAIDIAHTTAETNGHAAGPTLHRRRATTLRPHSSNRATVPGGVDGAPDHLGK